MDRATLLQIFQSRLERSDYSKLQKQGRTFYQEARRQASNTQARHIRIFSRAEVCIIPCIPFFFIVAISFRRLFYFPSVPLYMYQLWSCRCSLLSWLLSCCVVIDALLQIFILVIVNIANMFFFFYNCDVLSLLSWLHFTRIHELNGTE